MRVSRLFFNATLTEGDAILLDEAAGHYVRDVLRLRQGDLLTLFNGTGSEFPSTILELKRSGVFISIGAGLVPRVESPLHSHLGLGISKGERMDWSIQKAVELGITRITPLFTKHCVVRLDGSRKETRVQHWRKIAQSASEQCGRVMVPEIDPPVELAEWVKSAEGLKLLFDPDGASSLRELSPPEQMVSILSGPEGGFSETERTEARQAGFSPICLGPRILRTETAVLAALSVIQAQWGDWNTLNESPANESEPFA